MAAPSIYGDPGCSNGSVELSACEGSVSVVRLEGECAAVGLTVWGKRTGFVECKGSSEGRSVRGKSPTNVMEANRPRTDLLPHTFANATPRRRQVRIVVFRAVTMPGIKRFVEDYRGAQAVGHMPKAHD